MNFKVRNITKNTSGRIIHPDLSSDINLENVLLFLNETKNIGDYSIRYRGQRVDLVNVPGYINKNYLLPTNDPYTVVAARDIVVEGKKYASANDSLQVIPENTYYEVEYTVKDGKNFTLYPRAQINEAMGGILASPDINRSFSKDLYSHVSSIPDPTDDTNWGEMTEFKTKINQKFFVNDYVAEITGIERLSEVPGVELSDQDVAVKATIIVYGDVEDYTAEPIYLIKNKLVGRIPAIVEDLGVKFTFVNVHPETDSFSLGTNTTEKDYIILKAMEKPLINVLWLGTFLLLIGFGIAVNRRYTEFQKIRDKERD